VVQADPSVLAPTSSSEGSSSEEVAAALANIGQDATVEGLLPQPEPTKEEREKTLAINKGNVQLAGAKAIAQGSTPTSPEGAQVMAATLDVVVGTPPAEGEISSVGFEVVDYATLAIQNMAGATIDMDITDPDVKKDIFGTIVQTMGNLLTVRKELSQTFLRFDLIIFMCPDIGFDHEPKQRLRRVALRRRRCQRRQRR